MNTPHNAQNQYRIAIFSDVKDPARLQRIFMEQLNNNIGDPRSWHFNVPGILNETFSKDQATELVRVLNAEGLDCLPVRQAEILNVNELIAIVEASCGTEGLRFADFDKAHVGQIPWSAVRMICVGEVGPATVDTDVSAQYSPQDEQRGVHHPAHSDSPEHTLELVIACQRPYPDLRLHHQRMKHEYLGLRRATWTRIDFRNFLTELIHSASHALLTQSTRDYLKHVRHGGQQFSSFEELLRYASLHAVRSMSASDRVAPQAVPPQ